MNNRLLSILSCAVMLFTVFTAKSVTAYPGMIEFKQPNGQIVNIYIHGDEFLHWASTEDGYTLLYDDEGYLSYAQKEVSTGNLVPSKLRLLPADTSGRMKIRDRISSEGIEKGLWFSDEQVNVARQAKEALNQGMMKAPSRARWKEPVVGEKHFVMLLVEFQDVHFKQTKESFEKLMNQLNYHEDGHFGSVRDFYLENSFGKLDLVTDVFGVYRVSKDMAYYGGSSMGSTDNNPMAMFTEAVELADPEVDFSKYDNDGDGFVDGIHIIYAGHGEEAGGGEDCIWAHSMSFTLSSKFDGKKFNRYSCSPELRGSAGSKITYIGVICHEIGHVLGALDFYDTNYQAGGEYDGTGYYDLMSSGNWNGGGVCPAHFNPYSKIYDFRWGEAMECNSAQTVTLKAKDETSFFKIDTNTPGEYYLMEYRAQTGFDTCIPGHGLLVYHAADDLEEYVQNWINSINTTHRQRFYIVSANAPSETPKKDPKSYGYLNNSAPFPGRNIVEEFTDFSVPSMRSWNGAATDFPITSIEEDIENETVTFDVSGGKDGGASGFRVGDTDLTTITLTWKKKEEQTVLLAYSETIETGNPENGRDYTVGESIANCGKVLCFGTDAEYVHTNLEEDKTYYYRLYTKKDDGSWSAARTISGKTQVGVIRKFPFTEDFEEGKLGLNWNAETEIGNSLTWTLTNFDDFKLQSKLILNSSGTNFPHEKEVSRMILPQIDFTEHKCALLSFDYNNFLEELAIEYKASPTDEWHKIKTFGTMLNHDFEENGRTDENKILNAIRRAFVCLPQISPTYQLSFLATYKGNTGSFYKDLESITIDNIKIETDFDAYVIADQPSKVTNHTASIGIERIEGLVKLSSFGIEWSLNQKEWYQEEAKNGVARLEGLPQGTIIYYHTYAVETDGTSRYGETKEFKTISYVKGNGTESDPYVIENADEWEAFTNIVNEGNNCIGLYFSLGKSFTISKPIFATGEFNGTFDGKDFVITIFKDENFKDDYESLFNTIGQSGCVKNLNVLSKDLTFSTWHSAGICLYNDGTILNCTFKADDVFSVKDFSGICSFNYGWIVNCETEFEAESDYLISGICRNNYVSVVNCTSRGTYRVSNMCSLSGIVSYNSVKVLANGNRTGGLISNCANYVDFYKTSGEMSSSYGMGGICATSHQGRIENCINYGNIYGEIFNAPYSSYFYGNILGACTEMGTEITNCVNYGKIVLDCTTYGLPDEYRSAGMIGYSNGSTISNLVNLGSIEYFDTNNSVVVGDVIGTNSQSGTDNCFATLECFDEYTSKISSTNETLNILNDYNQIWTFNDKEHIALLGYEEDLHTTVGNIVDFGPEYINVPWCCAGENLSECKLQWRKAGEKSWNEVTGVNNSVNNTMLTGLTPKTIFEVRTVGYTKTGEVFESKIDSVATMFNVSTNDDGSYAIENYNDLLAFSIIVAHGESFVGKKFVLMHDIDMKGSKGNLWEPIRTKYSDSSFQGEFDGNGHVIYDMKIDTKKCYAGLFGIMNGYIHDLTVRDAEILCQTSPCVSGLKFPSSSSYCGVGGIAGDATTVERCGFEGTITGGNSIGGIAGNCSMVKDSYANALLQAGQGTYRISGISKEAVSNSYFIGHFSSEKELEWVGGISAGVNRVDNSYYNNDALEGIISERIVSRGRSIDATKMKEESFIEMLNPTNPDVWTIIAYVNDGYPVLAKCNTPRVTTLGAQCDEDGQIKLEALAFDGGNGILEERGFQFFSNTTNQQLMFDLNAAKENGIRFETYVENKAVPSIGINYRAYAVYANNDSIFGDWNEFVPDIVLPKLNLISVNYADEKGYVAYSIEVGTENIAKFELVTVTAKDDRHVQVLDPKNTKETIVLPSYEDFPLTTFIECTLSNGRIITSEEVIWGPYGIDGDANVDFRLTVADVTTALNYILDIYPRHFSKDNCDVNKDGNITVADATIITNMVMGATYNVLPGADGNTDASQSNLRLQIDDFSIENGMYADMEVRLSEAQNFVSVQMDVILNEGIKIVDVKVDDIHQMVWQQISENKYRVMIFSLQNECFTTDCIASLSLCADSKENTGEIKFDNIFMDSINGNEINEIMLRSGGANYSIIGSTGVEELRIDEEQKNQYFNLKGQRVIKPRNGDVYIVNGKKVIL